MVLSGEKTARIRQVLEKHPEGISITDLVKSVDINRNTAGRYLENLLLSGQVEMRRFGMAKLYTLTKRLPVSSVLSLSPELVIQLDSAQRVFYANDPLLRFLGVPAKDLFGKNIEFTRFSVVFEDVATELLDRFRKGLKGEEWHGELSRPVQERFFFCRIAPTVSNEGKKGVSILLEDISDRKRDEERIRNSEAHLRSIFMASPVGIGVVAGRVILEVNDRLCQMTGYSIGELIGRSTRMLYPSDEEFDKVGKLLYNQVQQSGTGSVESRWVRKDGTIIDVLMSSSRLDPANISGGITITALDITVRNRAIRALRESDERLQLALSGSETGMWEIDVPSMKGSIDERAAAILGYRKADIGPHRADWDALSHPDDVPGILQRLTDYLDGRVSIFESEHRMRHASGRWIWVVGRGKVTHQSKDGSCKRVAGTLQDITMRKLAEEALRESGEKYRHLVEQSLQGLTIIQNGRPVFVNAAMLEIGGFSYEEYLALGKEELMATVHPEDRDHIAKVMTARLEGKIFPAENEFRILRKDGRIRWVLTRGMLITYNGAPAIQVAYFDITERKLAEDALRESEDRYRKLVEISPNAVLLHRDRKIIYANQALARILGAEKTDDLLGRDVTDLVHPAYREVVRANIAKDLDGMATPFMELQMVRADGTIVIVEGQGVGTSIDGKPAVLVAITDITGRYRAELALKESEERYRSVFENTGAATAILEGNTLVSLINSEFERLSGYTKEEIEKKRSWTDFVVKEDLERMLTWHHQRRENGDAPHQYEAGVIKKNGEVRRALVTVGMIPGTNQSVVSLTDITDRKQAEQALRESESTARALLNAPTDTIMLLDNQGMILDLNDTAVLRLGRRREDVVGTLSDTVLPPDLAEERRRKISEVLTTRKPIRFIDERGGTWFDNVVYPILDNQENVARLAIIARDITDQKKAEAVLLESEERYRTLAESSQDLIFLIDRDDRVAYVNSYAAGVMGLPADQVVGKKRSLLFPGELGERQAQGLRRVFETGKAGRSEGLMEIFGTLHWFDHYLMPIKDSDGMVTSVLGVSRDITVRKSAGEDPAGTKTAPGRLNSSLLS